jgi:hypothetical protein
MNVTAAYLAQIAANFFVAGVLVQYLTRPVALVIFVLNLFAGVGQAVTLYMRMLP